MNSGDVDTENGVTSLHSRIRSVASPWSCTSIPSAPGRLSCRLSAPERRLRAGWRLLIFLVILLVVAAVEGRVRAGLAGRLPDLYEDLVRALVFALLIAAALYLASRVLDHRRMSDYGFHFNRKGGPTSASDWCWACCSCSG